MSDEQREPTFEEVLINRAAQRLGVAAMQIEALQLQVEQLQADNDRLRSMIPADPLVNGEASGIHSAPDPDREAVTP